MQSPADSGYRDQFSRESAFLQDTYMKNYYFSGLIYKMVNCVVGVILK